MMNPSSSLPVSVDYTSRDFYALRADLISRVKANIPEWQGTDAADFGVALIEAFAYMGDITNYYVDRMANEAYLPTATQRQSLLNIASLYGYGVTSLAAAATTLKFGNNTGSSITLPAGTQVFTDVVSNDITTRLIFTTALSVTIPANTAVGSSSYTSVASNYALISTANSYGIKLATSSTLPRQTYALSDINIVDSTISIATTVDGTTFVPWTRVTRLSEANSTDNVYTVTYDANNYPYITFGDNISGAIPFNDIYVQYGVGGGTVGNILAGQISAVYNSLRYVPGFDSAALATANAAVSITNSDDATGGTDLESSDSIRANATNAVQANQRAVSLNDYSNLASSIPGVGKANVAASTPGSVSLFVAPYRDTYGVESFPGRKTATTGITTEMDSLISVVSSVLSGKTQIGTTVTVNPPTYIRTALKVNYTSMSGYSDATVKANITSALETYFSYANVTFNQTISVEALSKLMLTVDGVSTIAIQDWYKQAAGASGSTPVPAGTSISSGDNGLFYLDTTNDLTLTVPNAIILSNLTVTGNIGYYYLDNPYSPTKFTYSISNAPGVSPGVVLGAPTIGGVTVSSPTLKINGTTYTYGSNITLFNCQNVGTYVFNVVVGNSSGTITANYTITVNTGSFA